MARKDESLLNLLTRLPWQAISGHWETFLALDAPEAEMELLPKLERTGRA